MITEYIGNSINLTLKCSELAEFDLFWVGRWELFFIDANKDKKVLFSGDVENLKDKLRIKITKEQTSTLEAKTYRLAVWLSNDVLSFDRLVVLESVKFREVI